MFYFDHLISNIIGWTILWSVVGAFVTPLILKWKNYSVWLGIFLGGFTGLAGTILVGIFFGPVSGRIGGIIFLFLFWILIPKREKELDQSQGSPFLNIARAFALICAFIFTLALFAFGGLYVGFLWGSFYTDYPLGETLIGFLLGGVFGALAGAFVTKLVWKRFFLHTKEGKAQK